MTTNLIRQLRGDEGSQATVYRDSLGLWTLRVGRLVDPSKPGAGLRPAEIDMLLANDVKDRIDALAQRLPWIAELDEARQGVLLNMSFQLGVAGLLGFVNTLALVKAGRWEEAARGMLASKWAQQTPNRAGRLAQQMRTGEWQFAPGT